MAKQNRFDCAEFNLGEIRTLSGVQTFAGYLARELRVNFHPDGDFGNSPLIGMPLRGQRDFCPDFVSSARGSKICHQIEGLFLLRPR